MAEKKVIPRAWIFSILFMLVRNTALRRSVYRFSGTVFKDFFLPQFANLFGVTRRAEINVDHPLDREIPFSPHCVGVYLGFIRYWVDAVIYLYRKGGKKSVPGIESFLEELSDLYRAAGAVYRTAHSTTQRPRYLKHPRFVVIHLFDPHLNCIPSLHVVVVCHALHELSLLADGLGIENSAEMKLELENRAVEIVESVLLVKQHSVNCVAAGLFCLSAVNRSFEEKDALQFVDKLFTRLEGNLPARYRVRSVIAELYGSFMRRFDQTGDARSVLTEFLLEYEKNISSSGKAGAVGIS